MSIGVYLEYCSVIQRLTNGVQPTAPTPPTQRRCCRTSNPNTRRKTNSIHCNRSTTNSSPNRPHSRSATHSHRRPLKPNSNFYTCSITNSRRRTSQSPLCRPAPNSIAPPICRTAKLISSSDSCAMMPMPKQSLHRQPRTVAPTRSSTAWTRPARCRPFRRHPHQPIRSVNPLTFSSTYASKISIRT